jgi:phospholipid/cholesterol/gamma-HCH transport system ATP-binding protein
MIEVKNIQKKFGEKVVIEAVSATMQTGRCNLIIGASGSGKTVFMKCMVGLLTPDQGEIFYDGTNFTNLAATQQTLIRKEIGMLFQGSALFDSLNVEQNIMFPLNMFTQDSLATKLNRVNEVLERVNLPGVNKKYPSELSGGMKKRVALARAIVLHPKYLFCDEPNSGLDPQTSLVIDKLIRELTVEYNITTVINTHDMNSVMEIGDYILYMYQGQKEWEGTREDIIFSKNQRLNDFIFASDFLRDAKHMRMQGTAAKNSPE